MDISAFQREWLIKGKVDFDHHFAYQCVDLVRQYFYQLFGLGNSAGGGNAIDYWTNTPSGVLTKFDKISSNHPRSGDVVVLYGVGGNVYGHIGIATGAVNGDKFEMLEQNGSTGNGSGTGPDAIRTRYIARSRIAGLLRPKAPAPPADGPSLPMPSGDFYNMPKGASFWGLEASWGLPHGTLNQLNPGVDPRRIAIGQVIRIRAARPAPAPAPTPVDDEFYTIQKGDTFWDLETSWGLAHGTLSSWNLGINPRLLSVGMKIRRRAPVLATALALAAPDSHPAAAGKEVVLAADPTEPAPVVKEELPKPTFPEPVLVPASPIGPATLDQVNSYIPRHPKPEVVTEQTWFRRTFTKEKILKDLTALGLFVGSVMAWLADNHALVAALLSTLGGVVFGENRFKVKK